MWLYSTWSNRVSGVHVWRRNPPCARRRNKESLLSSMRCAVGFFLPDLRITWMKLSRDHNLQKDFPKARVMSATYPHRGPSPFSLLKGKNYYLLLFISSACWVVDCIIESSCRTFNTLKRKKKIPVDITRLQRVLYYILVLTSVQ